MQTQKVLIAGAAIVVIVGAYFIWMSQDAQAPRPTSSTYTNATYGISFAIPEGYVLTEAERGNGERGHYGIVMVRTEDAAPRVDSEGPTALTVDIYQNNIDQLSLERWLTDHGASNFKLSSGMFTPTTVQGVAAANYTWSGLYEGETTAFLHKSNVVAVSVTSLTPEDQILTDYRALLTSFRLH